MTERLIRAALEDCVKWMRRARSGNLFADEKRRAQFEASRLRGVAALASSPDEATPSDWSDFDPMRLAKFPTPQTAQMREAVGSVQRELDAAPPIDAGEPSEAIAAFEAIMRAEGDAGYLSGPKGIAEAAVDQAVLFLYKHGRLTDEQVAELERRGSIGETARAALIAAHQAENGGGR